MEKILFIHRAIPFPVDRGDHLVVTRFAHAAQSRGMECHLLCFQRCENLPEAETLKLVEDSPLFVKFFGCPIGPKIDLLKAAKWFVPGRSYVHNRFRSPVLSAKLLEVLRNEEYTHIYVEHLYMAANLTKDPEVAAEISRQGIRVIQNVDVCEFVAFSQKLALNPSPLKKLAKLLFWNRELALIKREEIELAALATKTISMSADEVEYFAGEDPGLRDKLVHVDFLPDVADYAYNVPEKEQAKSLYFIGSYGWHPNADAVHHFLRDIFPLILAEVPDAKFHIVGHGASPQILACHDGKNVFHVGKVDSVFEESQRHAVCVVPLRVGSGTRLKIAEALSFGKAIVSSRVGVEGIPLHGSMPLRIADDPQSFARQVVELLLDDGKRLELKRKARSHAEEHFSAASFNRACDPLFGRRPASVPA